MRNKSLLALLFCASASTFACNDVLDNQAGELGSDGGPTVDGSTAPLDASNPPAKDAAADTSPAPPITTDDAGAPIAPACAADMKLCDGLCVDVADPLFGCSATSCSACSIARASATCSNGACVVATCDVGYADCDQSGANGCETDLAQATHCGACNAVCPSTAPDCAPTTSGHFACATGCGANAPTLCGTQCVDLKTSNDHCGDCNTPCAAVGNGATSCANGKCVFACNGGFHACGSSCVSNDQPATCGSSCAPCPTRAHAIATCNGVSCGLTCDTGYGDCNGNPNDGCETNLDTSSTSCGTCGHACGGGQCVNGACTTPPPVDAGNPPPPDAGPPPQDAAPPPPQDAAPPPPPDDAAPPPPPPPDDASAD